MSDKGKGGIPTSRDQEIADLRSLLSSEFRADDHEKEMAEPDSGGQSSGGPPSPPYYDYQGNRRWSSLTYVFQTGLFRMPMPVRQAMESLFHHHAQKGLRETPADQSIQTQFFLWALHRGGLPERTRALIERIYMEVNELDYAYDEEDWEDILAELLRALLIDKSGERIQRKREKRKRKYNERVPEDDDLDSEDGRNVKARTLVQEPVQERPGGRTQLNGPVEERKASSAQQPENVEPKEQLNDPVQERKANATRQRDNYEYRMPPKAPIASYMHYE